MLCVNSKGLCLKRQILRYRLGSEWHPYCVLMEKTLCQEYQA